MARKKIVLIMGVAVLCFQGLFSQSIQSPYNVFGIGHIESLGTGTNLSMGGAGIALESNDFLNNTNPASYSGMDTLSFLFDFGLSGKYTKFHSSSGNKGKYDAMMNYLAIGFKPIDRWGISVGMRPLSSASYSININETIEGTQYSIGKTYEGNGGVDQAYFSNSLRLFRGLSVGVNTSYFFGALTRSEKVSSTTAFDGYSLNRNNYIHSFYIDYGLSYSFHIHTMKYAFGLIYGNQQRLNNREKYSFEANSDTVDITIKEAKLYIPAKYGVGIAIEKGDVFKACFDYEVNDFSSMKFNNPLLTIRNSQKFSAGFEYNPNKEYAGQKIRTLKYRMGGYYYRSYLLIDNQPINSAAITFGIGVPVRTDLSLMNFSIELGRNGTSRHDLVREDYILFHMNLSLHDIWFQKVKFN